MKETVISVDEAARNFADFVQRAHEQDETFVLLENGRPFARLSPDHEKRCTGRDLAEVLAKTDLTEEEACVWRQDLQEARKHLSPPTDKWG